jgi:hypothetical protein
MIKKSLFLLGLGAIAGVLGATNPDIKSYRAYAIEALTDYSKASLCMDKSLNEFLQKQCVNLVDAAVPQVGELIDSSTERQNYLLFSIYKTNLAFSPMVPSFHFESIGVLNSFYTYRHEKGVNNP